MKPTAELVACAQRELRMRCRVYPRWVSQGKMTQALAEREIDCMADILALLKAKLESEPFGLDGGAPP